jgi:hypothetical protein
VPLRPQRRVTPGPGTAKEAKAYADYIGVHLQGIGKGKSYSEVSAESMKDSNNKELAQQRLAMFMGETLRGMLLNAWGWSGTCCWRYLCWRAARRAVRPPPPGLGA